MKIKLLPGTEVWLKKQKNYNAVVQKALFDYRKKLIKKKEIVKNANYL